MGMFDGINISGSALTANRFKMDVHADNIANQQTTRARLNEAGEWEPYRRKIVTQGAKGEQFNQLLHKAIGKQDTAQGKVFPSTLSRKILHHSNQFIIQIIRTPMKRVMS